LRIGELLRRLWPGGASRSRTEQVRYDDAARLEDRTQEHYRSITNSDPQGRPTKEEGSSQDKP
jgi:hypothetical protein